MCCTLEELLQCLVFCVVSVSLGLHKSGNAGHYPWQSMLNCHSAQGFASVVGFSEEEGVTT